MNEIRRACSSGSLFDALLNQFGSLTNAAHLLAQPACVCLGVSPLPYMPDLFNELVVDHFKFVIVIIVRPVPPFYDLVARVAVASSAPLAPR